jgi:hypothetical protein
MNLSEETLAMIKGLRKDVTTQGIGTGTGLNFFYLEPKAKSIYPVFYPLLASTPRVNPTFNGMKIGGTAVNWKAIVGIDSGGYPAISEGNRNAFMNMTTRNYSANYKYLGKDTEVSFQAQQTGLGFDDNIALSQLAMLNALLNDEERMLLFGNSGPSNVGGNGYALGTTSTPVTAQSNVTGAAVAASAQNYVFAVALTPWGVTLASATGVRLPFQRTNADGSQDIINGGTGVISAVSNSVVTDSSHKSITVTVPATVGAVGYAFYLNQVANTKSGAYFVGVSAFPGIVITATPPTSNQQANATDTGSGLDLTTDNSYNLLDFDGITTWGFGTSGSSQPAFLADAGGRGFTSNGDGTIAEFEAVADYLWLNYKISIDAIYLGGTLIQSASKAILTSSTGPGAQRLIIDRDATGAMTGGQIVTEYNWKYSNTARRKVVPIAAHPWLPQGVVLFDLVVNPYPAAGGDIPAVRRIVSLEDHFSIKWPYRKLQHELGVYCFETLEHYIPFGMGLYSGFSNTVN